MTVIFVDDIAISKDFYQQLFGFNIKHDFGENICFENGLSIWKKKRANQTIFGEKKKETSEQKNIELYFETNDIDSINKMIKQDKRIEIIHEIKEGDWGQRIIRIFDADRYIIEIGEPMKEVIKRYDKQDWSLNHIAQKTQMSMDEITFILHEGK